MFEKDAAVAQRVRRLLYNVICSFTRSYVRRDVISGNEVPPFKNNKTDELGGLNGLRGRLFYVTTNTASPPEQKLFYTVFVSDTRLNIRRHLDLWMAAVYCYLPSKRPKCHTECCPGNR